MWNLEIKQLLQQTRPLHYLDPLELDRLITYSKIITFAPGEILQKQGQVSDGVFILIQGEAIMTARVLGKELITLGMLEAGDFVGELLTNKPSAVSVIASTPIQCVCITKVYFELLGGFFPEMKHKISKAMTKIVCNRLRKIHKKVLEIMQGSTIITRLNINNLIRNFFTREKRITLQQSGFEKHQLKELFFDYFSEEEFTEILKYADLLVMPRNFILIKAGEINRTYYLILRGAVQLSIVDNNKIAKLTVLSPGAIICSLAYIDSKPAILTYNTCEQAMLLKIDENKLDLIKAHNITLWYKIYDTICRSIANREIAADRLFLRLNCEFYNEQ